MSKVRARKTAGRPKGAPNEFVKASPFTSEAMRRLFEELAKVRYETKGPWMTIPDDMELLEPYIQHLTKKAEKKFVLSVLEAACNSASDGFAQDKPYDFAKRFGLEDEQVAHFALDLLKISIAKNVVSVCVDRQPIDPSNCFRWEGLVVCFNPSALKIDVPQCEACGEPIVGGFQLIMTPTDSK